jgi:hypothetical protein
MVHYQQTDHTKKEQNNKPMWKVAKVLIKKYNKPRSFLYKKTETTSAFSTLLSHKIQTISSPTNHNQEKRNTKAFQNSNVGAIYKGQFGIWIPTINSYLLKIAEDMSGSSVNKSS